MSKRIDLTGQTFGKLTVLRNSGRVRNAVQWECACACGGRKFAVSGSLRYGKTKSCGCESHPKGNANARWTGAGEISGNYLAKLKDGAERRGMAFMVTPEYLWGLAQSQNLRCAYSGVVLDFSRDSQTASLDRVNSDLCYMEGNVQWIHKDYNRLKSDLPEDKLFSLVRRIYEHRLAPALI